MTFNTQGRDLVSGNIKRYIQDKQGYLLTNPWYTLHLWSLTKSGTHREVNRHSVGMELVDYNMTKSECLAMKRKERRRCEEQLAKARKWSIQNYSEPLTLDYIENLGKIVDPQINSAGFRQDKVRVTGSRVSPPGGEKVRRELNIFLLENEALENPLEKAIHAHLNLARVHPFDDGNGRTARLVQDAVLYREHLPLPVIGLPERGEYIQKVESAIYSSHMREAGFDPDTYKKLEQLRDMASQPSLSAEIRPRAIEIAKDLMYRRVTPEQNYFYDFIALKVLEGLTEEIKRVFPSEREMINHLRKHKTKKRA